MGSSQLCTLVQPVSAKPSSETLRRHELIKVKLPKLDDASAREALAEALTLASGAALVQLLGRVLVLYTPRAKDLPGKPKIQLPRA
jgi:RNA-binding protein